MLSPPRTLDSTVLHIIRTRLVQDYPQQIQTCLSALTEDQLWWRPNEQSNSVANLLIHLAGSNRHYLQHVVAGESFERDRAAEFAARGTATKSELDALWRESVISTERVLSSIAADRLMDTTERGGKPTTVLQVLLHVSHHNAVHMGQIVYLAKQLNPAAIDDIWMKSRAR